MAWLAHVRVLGGAVDGRHTSRVGGQTLRGQGPLQDMLIARRLVPLLATLHLDFGGGVVVGLIIGFGR